VSDVVDFERERQRRALRNATKPTDDFVWCFRMDAYESGSEHRGHFVDFNDADFTKDMEVPERLRHYAKLLRQIANSMDQDACDMDGNANAEPLAYVLILRDGVTTCRVKGDCFCTAEQQAWRERPRGKGTALPPRSLSLWP